MSTFRESAAPVTPAYTVVETCGAGQPSVTCRWEGYGSVGSYVTRDQSGAEVKRAAGVHAHTVYGEHLYLVPLAPLGGIGVAGPMTLAHVVRCGYRPDDAVPYLDRPSTVRDHLCAGLDVPDYL
jgi:hypothetical protein